MTKVRKSKEFVAFDKIMGQLLSVPKRELDARVAEHKQRATENPRRRGPKPKVRTDADASGVVSGDEAAR